MAYHIGEKCNKAECFIRRKGKAKDEGSKQTKRLDMKTNAVQPTPSRDPIYFQLPAGVLCLAGTKEGRRKTRGTDSSKGRKFTINDQGKHVVAQVYFSLSVFAAIFAKLSIDSNSLK